MNRRHFIAASAVSLVLDSAAGATLSAEAGGDPQVGDGLNPPGIEVAGIRMLAVAGGKHKVWTKRFGRGGVKVLALHGGPAFAHDYLEVFESFLPAAGIELYQYDQLGCGNSDRPEDPSLWTVSRYVEEVEEVRRGLGLDHFVLYGHSAGGVLAIDYALKYQSHLRGLVISNMAAGMRAYMKRIAWWKSQLTPAVRAELEGYTAKADFDNPGYVKIMMEVVWPQMICRTRPWPEPLERSLRNANMKIYEQMQGKSEFVMTGNMKNWERWDRLREIKVKALTMGARYDEMDPEDLRQMAGLMPNATYAYCPNGSHLAMYDDQAVYFSQLLAFLRTV